MLDVLLVEQAAEAMVTLAGATVSEHEERSRSGRSERVSGGEQYGREMGLIGQDRGEADAAVIVESDMEILIARAAGFAACDHPGPGGQA